MDRRIKIGVFGAWRGQSFISLLKHFKDDAYCCAVCDKNEKMLEHVKQWCEEGTQFFTDVDEFFECEMDAVILCNYFHEHAPYSIRALDKGIHVLSETTAAGTLKECVELVEAQERASAIYALAENYPYMLCNQELERIYKGGTLGNVIYAEGEYVHPMNINEAKYLTPKPLHWRAWLPRTYYLTHSLAPLMMITDTMPVAVNAKSVHSELFDEMLVKPGLRKVSDMASIMLVEMNNGALFRVTGSAGFGPHGNWYRLACEKGGAESIRGNQNLVRLAYNPWNTPEGEETDRTYHPEWPSHKELADKAGHGGGDFWVIYHFISNIKEGTKPFFDVYKAVSMSAVGILAWRSSLESGREYKIPDFRNKEVREKYRHDDLSPFPDENGKATLPCSSKYADWYKKD